MLSPESNRVEPSVEEEPRFDFYFSQKHADSHPDEPDKFINDLRFTHMVARREMPSGEENDFRMVCQSGKKSEVNIAETA